MDKKVIDKEAIIAEYLTGNMSYREMGIKYGIDFSKGVPSHDTIERVGKERCTVQAKGFPFFCNISFSNKSSGISAIDLKVLDSFFDMPISVSSFWVHALEEWK
jgi:hypothetical protein